MGRMPIRTKCIRVRWRGQYAAESFGEIAKREVVLQLKSEETGSKQATARR